VVLKSDSVRGEIVDILAEFDMLGEEYWPSASPLSVSIPQEEWGGNPSIAIQEIIDLCMSDVDNWEITIWRDDDGAVSLVIVNEDEELD
jgi:hypothetical protein